MRVPRLNYFVGYVAKGRTTVILQIFLLGYTAPRAMLIPRAPPMKTSSPSSTSFLM